LEEKDLAALADTWQLELPPGIQEGDLLAALSQRVAVLLAGNLEAFFQIMYSLDISEVKLNNALSDTNPPDAIARLLYLRQWEKAISRSHYKDGGVADDVLRW
jgi:hypothetical protein